MTNTSAKRIVAALTVVIALAAFPAIYASARTDASSNGWAGRMMGGCAEMMNGTSVDRGMGGGMEVDSQADRGMMGGGMMGGGDPPNQQWRR